MKLSYKIALLLSMCLLTGCTDTISTSVLIPDDQTTTINIDADMPADISIDIPSDMSDINVTVLDSDSDSDDSVITDSETWIAKDNVATELRPYVVINDNCPFFTEEEINNAKNGAFEEYSSLDDLLRPHTAMACIDESIMPTEDEVRGEIGMIKPAGWHSYKYPDIIADLWLYNRCHLIGWQLSGENANECNLMTGTRYLNVEGMLDFENQVADYVHTTKQPVLYRVTPYYLDNELIARGVIIEAMSLYDADCIFCIYCYNVQPGIIIDYATGESHEQKDDENLILITPDI